MHILCNEGGRLFIQCLVLAMGGSIGEQPTSAAAAAANAGITAAANAGRATATWSSPRTSHRSPMLRAAAFTQGVRIPLTSSEMLLFLSKTFVCCAPRRGIGRLSHHITPSQH